MGDLRCRRKSFDSTELKIKFLSAADFDASGARTQEISTSPLSSQTALTPR